MFDRYEGNPIIKPSDLRSSEKDSWIVGTFNPGAIDFGGKIILLLRVAEGPGKEGHSTTSHIRLAKSDDGVNFSVEEKAFIYPTIKEEKYGVEDPRVTLIEGEYLITYTGVSEDSWSVFLATTEDFHRVEKKGVIFPDQDKDCCIFPEKINGKYVALHRPVRPKLGKPSIWYSESTDLKNWNNRRQIMRPRDNKWESKKIGVGPPPIKTPEGWLILYHAKGKNDSYSLSVALLDLDNPHKVLRRSSKPLFYPSRSYEKKGFIPNVVFANGLVDKNGQIFLYYGAADKVTCLATTSINNLLGYLEKLGNR